MRNRIADGRFTLDGASIGSTLNDGTNALHGGAERLRQALVGDRAVPAQADGSVALELALHQRRRRRGLPGQTAT